MLMKRRIFFTAILIMFIGGFSAARQPDTVKVEGGLAQGTSEDGLKVYKGIPFAAPPVGDLRWSAPQPAAKWDGVLKVDKFAPSPVQGMRMGNMGGQGSGSSEDCIYFNIWSLRNHQRTEFRYSY